MRFIFINTDYPGFLSHWYENFPNAAKMGYKEQIVRRYKTCFGVSDFYSSNMRRHGHEACDIFANNEIMQRRWMYDHGKKLSRLGLPGVFGRKPSWYYEVLAEQLRFYRPDVIVNQAMEDVSEKFLKKNCNGALLVGQIAAPLPDIDYHDYDLIISSLPNFVDHFKSMGIPSELNRLAFEPKVLEHCEHATKETVPASFVGSFSNAHDGRAELVEYLCKTVDLLVWTADANKFPGDSPVIKNCCGEAWGVEMFNVLHNSRITINQHINVAGAYANNMRLYEATGSGALLLTDYKENIGDMFTPDKEVVLYHNKEECAELAKYYLEHEPERAAIAKNGQQRTMKDHTYYKRTGELLEIVEALC